MDPGIPSRILFSGDAASYALGEDEVITLLAPGNMQILIENPAYSGRAVTLTIEVTR